MLRTRLLGASLLVVVVALSGLRAFSSDEKRSGPDDVRNTSTIGSAKEVAAPTASNAVKLHISAPSAGTARSGKILTHASDAPKEGKGTRAAGAHAPADLHGSNPERSILLPRHETGRGRDRVRATTRNSAPNAVSNTSRVSTKQIAARTGFPDCNNNGIDDALDISSATSQDCNTNAIPDECEFAVTGLTSPATFATGLVESSELATDGNGVWIAAWSSWVIGGLEDGDIYFARSTDNGETWSSPGFLNSNALVDEADDSRPRLTTDGNGLWIAVWDSFGLTDTNTLGADYDILFSRSTDNGLTWSASAPLNTLAASDAGPVVVVGYEFFDDDSFPWITTDRNGTWMVVWNYSYNGGEMDVWDYDIMVSRSVDGGVTWSTATPLNTDATTDDILIGGSWVQDDIWPSLATDGQGVWIAVWSGTHDPASQFESDFDIYFARSTDQGVTWSSPQAINSDAITPPGGYGRDESIPRIATDKYGHWVVIWNYFGSTLGYAGFGPLSYSRSADNGLHWSRTRDLPSAGGFTAPTDYVSGQVLAVDSSGNWIATWSQEVGTYEPVPGDDLLRKVGDFDLLYSRSTDYGATWASPRLLNSDAMTDLAGVCGITCSSGDSDRTPSIATDNQGHWVATWRLWREYEYTQVRSAQFTLRDTDCNANGIPDQCDLASGLSQDADADGVADTCVPDCNSNGTDDANDIWAATSTDCDFNGTPDECEDCNNNGAGDACDVATGASLDTCGWNGIPNECEPDCDADGQSDSCELFLTQGLDCNGNGLPDSCDIAGGTVEDCSGNGIPDFCEADCNGNAVADSCDILSGTSTDCNANGIPDACEVAGILPTGPDYLNTDGPNDGFSGDVGAHIATDGTGIWIAAFSSPDKVNGPFRPDENVFMARSLDNGRTWSSPRPVVVDTSPHKSATGVSDIAAADGTWMMVGIHFDHIDPPLPSEYAVWSSRSTDAGLTWSAPVAVSQPLPLLGTPRVAADGQGRWMVVWFGRSESVGAPYGQDSDVFFSISSDDGVTWSLPASPDLSATSDGPGDVDSKPVVDTDGNGVWTVVWEYSDLWSGGGVLAYARSTDNGATWAAATLILGSDRDQYHSLSNIDVTTDRLGHWIALWALRTEGILTEGFDGVLFARSLDNGASWRLPRILDSNGNMDAPSLSTDRQGRWVATWEDDNYGSAIGSRRDIIYSASRDVGHHWSAPQPLNPDHDTVGLYDWHPDLATDGRGLWLAAWSRLNVFPTTWDGDVVFSRFVFAADDCNQNLTPDGCDVNTGASQDVNADGVPDECVTDCNGNGDEDATEIASGLRFDCNGNGIPDECDVASLASADCNLDSVPDECQDCDGDGLADSCEVLAGATDCNANDVPDSCDVTDGASAGPYLVNIAGSPGTGEDRYPSIATDRAGNWISAWGSNANTGGTLGTDRDILFARSTSRGSSWSTSSALNWHADLDATDDDDQSPVLATDGSGTWIAAWTSWTKDIPEVVWNLGSDADILFARSLDNGVTWSDPWPLNSAVGDIANNVDRSPAIATNGTGTWIVVYSVCCDDPGLFYVRSLNNGADWTAPARLDGTVGVGQAGTVKISSDGASNWMVVWRANVGGIWKIMVIRSTDGGATWSAPASLNPDGIHPQSDDYPDIAADGMGNWMAVWESYYNFGGTAGTDRDIVYVRSRDNGATWTSPVLVNSNAQFDAGQDSRPRVLADHSGRWVVVWDSTDNVGVPFGGEGDILLATSLDVGARWTPVRAVNADAQTDAYNTAKDEWAALATDYAGNWVVVWQRGNSFEDLDVRSAWIRLGTSPDCNDNGVPDTCDIVAGTVADVDGNGRPDECQCGNQLLELAEQCDGPDDDSCPGKCLADCRCSVCGDGVVEGSEQCDTGGESPTCDSDCTLPMCGDNLRNASAGEMCDGSDIGDCFDYCLPDCICEGGVLFVDVDALGNNNGTSWGNAYTNLQTALAASNSGQQIWVAEGTYHPAPPGGDRFASFVLREGVGVYGGFAGTETLLSARSPQAHLTILSGDLNSDDGTVGVAENSYHVVRSSGAGSLAELDGFTIKAGNANGGGNEFGGGMLIGSGGSPTIRNCTFVANSAAQGGGAVYQNSNASVAFEGCRFNNNTAVFDGGAVFVYHSSSSAPTSFVECSFSGNTSISYGGALSAYASSGTIVVEAKRCVFSANTGRLGGAVAVASHAAVVLSNCLFHQNVATQSGGAVTTRDRGFGSAAGLTIANSTIAGNSSAGDGGGFYSQSGPTGIVDSIFWGNTGQGGSTMNELAQIAVEAGTVDVTYTAIQGLSVYSGGAGNTGADPLFVNATGNDYHLSGGSPAVDVGSNSAVTTTQDLDGAPRIADGNNDGSAVVDLGAYERPVCGNGIVEQSEECEVGDVGACQFGCDTGTCTCTPSGACCTAGTPLGCEPNSQIACMAGGGMYRGNGSTCATALCSDFCAYAKPIPSVPYTDTVAAASATTDTNVNPSCDSSSACASGAGYGVWWSYTPTETCKPVISETGTQDVVITMWTGGSCSALTGWTLSTSDTVNCSNPESNIKFDELSPGSKYYILISKYSCSSAPTTAYGLSFDCAVCGDGLVTTAAGETCEEGGVNTATCDFDCTAPACRDGVLNPMAGETCEPGVDETACTYGCDSVACTCFSGPSIVHPTTGTVTTLTCDATYYDSGGPSATYSANETGVQTICPDRSDLFLTVTFNQMSLEDHPDDSENCYDEMVVYDGPDTLSWQIIIDTARLDSYPPNSYCPDATDVPVDPLPPPFVAGTPGGCLTFDFNPDGSGLRAGWVATVACTMPIGCGNWIVEPPEECDGGMCCDPVSCVVFWGYTCRPSSGECDPAETCSDWTGECPPDQLSTDLCRPSSGACDPGEFCDGVNVDCPIDVAINACADDDGCCASGCSAANDNDCAPVCGDGIVEPGEDCETGICCAANCLFKLGSTICRGAADICDLPEQCTGLTADCPTDVRSSDVCRPSTGACDPEESCDGVNVDCPIDVTIAICADQDGCCAPGCNAATDNDCAAICGNGIVEPGEDCESGACCNPYCQFEPMGVSCRPSTGACDLEEFCVGSNASCPIDESITSCEANDGCCPPSCSVANDTDCTPLCGNGSVDPGEACDGGACCDVICQFEPGSTLCRGPAGICDLPEFCTGAMADCPADAYSTDLCRPSTGACDPEEFCDGFDLGCPIDVMITACADYDSCCPPGCSANNDNDCTPICGNGIVEPGEDCETGACCNANCQFESGSTMCRGTAGICDLPEFCTGATADCPADVRSADLCRPSTGACDPEEFCDGSSVDCPIDLTITDCADDDGCCPPGCNANNDNNCTPICGNGIVEPGEDCETGACCNVNCQFEAVDVTCRLSLGVCDLSEMCTGTSGDCPVDRFSTGECRASAGPCDPLEFCTGTTPECPVDVRSTDLCRPSTGACDPEEFCDGSSVNCPMDLTITNCAGDDGCCPPDCNAINDNDCTPMCGNAVAENGEACDTGGDSATCDSDCTLVVCGDGLVNAAAGEQCDGMNDLSCPGQCGGNCDCQQVVPDLQVDPTGISKSRFLSFSIPAAATAAVGESALRVNLTSLHHVVPPYSGGLSVAFTQFEGQSMFVGPPVQYLESSSGGIPFYASSLQCTPHYQDWSTVGLLHVTGSAIVPSSTYEVENLAASCTGNEASCTAVSAPLEVATTRWGDVSDPYNPPSSTVQPDVADIGALVNKFRNAPGAPIKARAELAGAPGNPWGEITPAVLIVDLGFSHIAACVDAFRGVPYPYKMGKCAGNTSACTTNSDCGASGPCNLYCP